jgi:hypothetical protein
VAVSNGPTVLRWPKGNVGAEAEAIGKLGGMDVLASPAEGLGRDVLLLGAGPMAVTCVDVAARLAGHGIGVTVTDPRWVKPVDPVVIQAVRRHRLVAVVEDNGRAGGFGDAVCRLLRDADVDTPCRTFGLPQEFLDHGPPEAILDAAGLSAQHLARQPTEAMARRTLGAGDPGAPDAAQANFGRRDELTLTGIYLGDKLANDNPIAAERSVAPPGAGSVIVVVATNAPLFPSQCKAMARRVSLGLARTGTTGSHSSSPSSWPRPRARDLSARDPRRRG